MTNLQITIFWSKVNGIFYFPPYRIEELDIYVDEKFNS